MYESRDECLNMEEKADGRQLKCNWINALSRRDFTFAFFYFDAIISSSLRLRFLARDFVMFSSVSQ